MDAPQARDLPDLLTPTEVANLFRVTPAAVRKWAREGLLPRAKVPGRLVRFRRDEVLAFLSRQEVVA